MNGLELCERFYNEYGAPMLREKFPEVEELIAVGLAGSGSECLGYDDELSRDHDFEAGFCLFLPDESVIDRKTEFALERAYSKLPKEFMGFKRSTMSPVGGNRHGVIRMSDFFSAKTGVPDGKLSIRDWFSIPEQALLEATNGKVFKDDLGVFSKIRGELEYLPTDVRLKKLAGNLLIMGQTGQYNYPRCIKRGERAAAQLAICEFTKASINVIFLLNKQYVPYYKWTFRSLSKLEKLNELYEPLEYLISSSNTDDEAQKKQAVVERICEAIIEELKAQKLSSAFGTETERHAYAVNDLISDGQIRNLHILFAV